MHFYTTFDDFPSDIASALRRAKARWAHDPITNTRFIWSTNPEAPLTVKEKERISEYLSDAPFYISFKEDKR